MSIDGPAILPAGWRPWNNGTVEPTTGDRRNNVGDARALSHLSSSDKALLASMGEHVGTLANGMSTGLSALGSITSSARESGTLPTGAPVDAAFLAEEARRYPSSPSIRAQIQQAVDVLAQRGGTPGAQFDATA